MHSDYDSSHELPDAERYPTLTEHGQHMLDRLRQHPHAPLFRNRAGNRLTAEDVARVRAFDAEAAEANVTWPPGNVPAWVEAYTTRCYANVPFFHARGTAPARFNDIPTTSRADLANDVAQFVPDSMTLDRLINFRTSGTSGHPLLIPSHPMVAASYLAFHKRALRRFGVVPHAGRGEVAVVLLGHQRQCFTYVSVVPMMDEAGYVKLNLHPDDWRDPDDRARYLDALQPEILSGDPISFTTLLELPLTWKPRAMVSTSMTLTPALRAELEARFDCPVLDVYSMNEAGPIAVFDPKVGGHVLLQHTLYVEILDMAGNPCASGESGEIVLTGGFNFCLPLLRYRTGDHAMVERGDKHLFLKGFNGRAPVRFHTADGAWINSNDVTHALRGLPLRQFRVCQQADAAIGVEYDAQATQDHLIEPALRQLFGRAQPLTVVRRTFGDAKVVQYVSELPPDSKVQI